MRLRDVSFLIAGGLLAVGGMWFLNSVAGVDDAADAQATALPRTAEGKPDLSGLWQVMNTANYDIEDHPASPGVPAGMGIIEGNEIPYQPWALAKKQENYKNR